MTAKTGFPNLDGIVKGLSKELEKVNKLGDLYNIQSSKAVNIEGQKVMASINAKKVVMLEFETEQKAKEYYDNLNTNDQ